VDAFRRDKNGWHLLAADCAEAKLLDLLSQHRGHVRIVLSPLGNAGFVLGRGTAPLSPQVVRTVGVESVVVIATPSKLRGLDALVLDSGDEALNRLFSKYVRVVVGADREKLMPVDVITR
jgi:predicted polyphosphate/ATP-dependent NAD kinase